MKRITGFLISMLLALSMISSIVLAAQKPSLQATKKSIGIAETYQIKINDLPKDSTVKFASNKSGVASVDQKGKVTGITAGKAKITVKVKAGENTYLLYLTVTVKEPAFSSKSSTLTVGEIKALKISNKPKKGATYTWKSSNSKVAVVSNGRVKALKAGTAKVTVSIKTSKRTYTLNHQVTVKAKSKTEKDYLNYLSSVSKKHTNTDGETDAAGALEDVIKTAKEGMNEGIIKDYDKSGDGISVEFSSGIVFVYQKPDAQVDAAGTPDKMDIITLQPYLSSYGSGDKNKSTKSTDNAALKIATELGYAYFSKNYDDKEVTLSTITSIGPDEIVLIHSHGWYNESYGSVLWLGETASDSDIQPGGSRYDDLCNKRLVLTEDRRFGITSAFVTAYCKKMNNAFLYLGTCYSGKDSRLAYSFINKGASAVIGNSETIYRSYNLDMMEDVVDGLLEKDKDGYSTLELALKKAKTTNGSDDSEWYRRNYSGSSAHAPATPVLFGDKSYRFVDSSANILPTGISISKSDVAVKKGEKLSLTATVTPSNATDKTVKWRSDDTSVATVKNGTITAVGSGSTYIYASTSNGYSAVCLVKVVSEVVAPSGITLSDTKITLTEGNSEQITATIKPSNASDQTVTWSSEDETIASVRDGVITGLKVGNTYIHATTVNGLDVRCTVTVTAPYISPTNITMSTNSIHMVKGYSVYIYATIEPQNASNKSITWGSSDNSIATVVNGKITGISTGLVYITATTVFGQQAICQVYVHEKSILPTSIRLTKNNIVLNVGDTDTLKAVVFPADATNVTVQWSSNDISVVSVSVGKITARKPGTAIITGNAGNGMIATCKVTVQ